MSEYHSPQDLEKMWKKAYEQGRNDAIEKYSNKLWIVIESMAINCKFDFTIEDLRNLEIVIKGLAEEYKEKK